MTLVVGKHVISISYFINDPNCCKVEALLNHEITLKVIGKWLHTDSSKVADYCVGVL